MRQYGTTVNLTKKINHILNFFNNNSLTIYFVFLLNYIEIVQILYFLINLPVQNSFWR